MVYPERSGGSGIGTVRAQAECQADLYLLTGNRGEAEELAQATMARIYERWSRVRVMQSPVGYVYRAAVNLHRQRLRHLAVRARRLLAMAVHAESTQAPGAGRSAGAP